MRSNSCILEIDLTKIHKNYQILSQIRQIAKIAPVFKANAYGLGTAKLVAALELEGAKDFFVAKLEEGITLCSVLSDDANIYGLNRVFQDELESLTEYNLTPILLNKLLYGKPKLLEVS